MNTIQEDLKSFRWPRRGQFTETMYALVFYKDSIQSKLEFNTFWKAKSGDFEEHYFKFKYF